MSTETFLIIGAGGHAKVVLDALRCERGAAFGCLLADDDAALAGKELMGLSIVTPVSSALHPGRGFHVAIGSNAIRERIADDCAATRMACETVKHPRSICAASASIARGCFIAAGAIVSADADIAQGCIVNHGAVVDHDSVLGAFCHVAPNATLGGGVRLGKRVLIGSGASILPGISIADDCIVGAGAVVLHDLPAGSVYAGVPARRI
jgi:sugar O-acyltransferase (sialic acid O-acetyltransferase NeuD family)